MREVFAVLLGVVLGCSTTTPELRGTWRSDRPLTLAELANVDGIATRERAMLERPTFFGELVLVIDDVHITSVLPYDRASNRYRILDSGDDYVTVESTDAKGERQTVRCLFRDGHLLVPIPELGFHEVFVRMTDVE